MVLHGLYGKMLSDLWRMVHIWCKYDVIEAYLLIKYLDIFSQVF